MDKKLDTSLYFKQGSADKIYIVSLINIETDSWVVQYSYGRRGKPLQSGSKTPKPLDYLSALTIYDKLVRSKEAKGYIQNNGVNSVKVDPLAGERTGWLPQLLNPIKEKDLIEVFAKFAPNLYVQQKHDGERRGIIFKENKIIPANRKGLRTEINENIKAELVHLHSISSWLGVFDTEDMSNHVVLFDYIPTHLTNTFKFYDRAIELNAINLEIKTQGLEYIQVDIPIHIDSYADLLAFIEKHRQLGSEGIVIRDGLGIYTPGRPNSGGPALKLKFVKSATVIVDSIHPTKRSIAMSVLTTKGEWINIGNCTIPPNHKLPWPQDLVEVEYLYAYRGGSLYQPVYKGRRTDLTYHAAIESQLEYKN